MKKGAVFQWESQKPGPFLTFCNRVFTWPLSNASPDRGVILAWFLFFFAMDDTGVSKLPIESPTMGESFVTSMSVDRSCCFSRLFLDFTPSSDSSNFFEMGNLFEAAKVCNLVTLLSDDWVSIEDESRKILLENDLDDRESGPKRRKVERESKKYKGRCCWKLYLSNRVRRKGMTWNRWDLGMISYWSIPSMWF